MGKKQNQIKTTNYKLTMDETSAIFPAGCAKGRSIGREPLHRRIGNCAQIDRWLPEYFVT
jgi:hypothetical protein